MSEASRNRWLLPLAIAVGVVALVAIALLREPVQLNPDSPEGTVQVYLQSINDEDYETAFAQLDPEAVEGCLPPDIARFAPSEPFSATLGDIDADRPVRVEPDPPGEITWVQVTMRFGSSEPSPFRSEWENQEWFLLVERDGVWRITDNPWPHFHWDCRDQEV